MRHAYLLLDNALIENLPRHLLSLGQFMPCHPLYLTTDYAELADCGPLLVPVVPDSPLAQLFNAKWRLQAGLWLETEAPEPVLLDHLRSLVHVSLDGDVTTFFRYYDPRIARVWLQDLAPAERGRVMGPVQSIRLPAEDGSDLLISNINPASGQRYTTVPWLRLSATQLEQLSEARYRQFDQHLIEHCQRYFPHVLQGLDRPAQYAWAKACQDSARRHGYSTKNEITRWVSLYALLGANFPDEPTHQPYRQILQAQGRSPAQRLDDLIDELTLQRVRSLEPHA